MVDRRLFRQNDVRTSNSTMGFVNAVPNAFKQRRSMLGFAKSSILLRQISKDGRVPLFCDAVDNIRCEKFARRQQKSTHESVNQSKAAQVDWLMMFEAAKSSHTQASKLWPTTSATIALRFRIVCRAMMTVSK
jgi:hypothetical protein